MFPFSSVPTRPAWPGLVGRLGALILITSASTVAPALAAPAELPAPAGDDKTVNSTLDAPLFYQLLIGEMELRQGEPATAYAVLLDAARRTRDEGLYRRAMEIALRAQAGNEALVAVSAWRQAHPRSIDAVRSQVQILLAMGRVAALAEPLRQLIELTPQADRAAAIAGLPRLLGSQPDRRQALQVLQSVLIPLADAAPTRTPAQLALARSLGQAGQTRAALALLQDVAQRQPEVPGTALAALDLADAEPEAEALARQYLTQPQAEAWVRMAYAQWLGGRRRYPEAATELQAVTRQTPQLAQAWQMLGSLLAETGDNPGAEAALKRFLSLREQEKTASAAPADRPGHAAKASPAPGKAASATDDDDDEEAPATRRDPAVTAAKLLLSQLAADRRDFTAAQQWLDTLGDSVPAAELQARRALLLARQGRLDQARALVRSLPESTPQAARDKVLAESQVLRSVERWSEARQVLQQGLTRHPDDVDILYELSLTLERLGRHDDMERHLRRIIEIQPNHHHAHNALGYSFAERGIRLDEARTLIERALSFVPGDPFITDSLGWVEFRAGRLDRAVELLQQAWRTRPDAEIGTHLGEVLWVRGERDEARKVWRAVQSRDRRNKTLQETLARLKVDL